MSNIQNGVTGGAGAIGNITGNSVSNALIGGYTGADVTQYIALTGSTWTTSYVSGCVISNGNSGVFSMECILCGEYVNGYSSMYTSPGICDKCQEVISHNKEHITNMFKKAHKLDKVE